jgi:hypothetical protein
MVSSAGSSEVGTEMLTLKKLGEQLTIEAEKTVHVSRFAHFSILNSFAG